MSSFHGHGGDERQEEMQAEVESYLSTVLMPSLGATMSARNERELRTLAKGLDKLVKGDAAGAADVLVQRFKAVETASSDGHWGIAKHHELLPSGAVSAVPDREREAAARMEKEERKLRATTAAPGRDSR